VSVPKSLLHVLVDPGQEVENVRVDPGDAVAAATDSPGHQTHDSPLTAARVFANQRCSTVALEAAFGKINNKELVFYKTTCLWDRVEKPIVFIWYGMK